MGNSPLAGRTALITGSTSGIGLGIARSLAAHGAAVIINSEEPATAGKKIAAEIAGETGASTLFCSADVSDPEDVRDLVRTAIDWTGQIDILVNNAGIQHVAPIPEFPEAKWDAILAINLSAAFHATKAALPGMKTRRWGRIINIASVHGLVASPFKAAYVAAKHGLIGLTKVTALECAEDGITCNAICPGYVATPLVEKQIDDQAKHHGIPRDAVIRDVILAPQPNKQFVAIDEIAALVLYLVGESGRSVTGSALTLDGGWTAR